MTPLLLVFLLLASEPQDNIVTSNGYDCLLVRGPEDRAVLNVLVGAAIGRGCRQLRLQGGLWEVQEPVLLGEFSSSTRIQGNPSDSPVVLRGDPIVFQIRNANGIALENLVVEGTMELEKTEGIVVRGVEFRRGGMRLKGRRCNQPNECTDYNRDLVVEDCVFVECEKGLHAERLERSLIQNNRFLGRGISSSCLNTVGIELDGSSEDLDRVLELGHSKANRILNNTFDLEFATGIRIQESLANVIRDNHFDRSFRAIEVLQGARFNRILSNHIGYLSQLDAPAACHSPCAMYAGPGAMNNLFLNNFFEMNFELRFLERHRNNAFIIDESGGLNVFRSDFRP